MGYYTPFKHMLAEGVNKAEQRLAGSDYRMVTVYFNVDPIGTIDVDEVIDKLEAGRFDELTDEELLAFVRLLTESDEFSPEAAREAMKSQIDEFLDRVDEAAERRAEQVQKMSD
jgi:hypothetical protein